MLRAPPPPMNGSPTATSGVAGMGRNPGPTARQPANGDAAHEPVDGPAVGQQPSTAGIGQRIVQRPDETVSRVKAGVRLLGRGVEAVVGLGGVGNIVVFVAGVVDRVRPRVNQLRGDAPPGAQVPRGLQTAVMRVGRGLGLVDDVEVREREGTAGSC